jgi:uncharacterized membrane protein
MATLTAFKFSTAEGAETALEILLALEQQQLISFVDAALVTWPKGKNRPSTRQVGPTKVAGMLDGTFWGMLFGVIFFVPVLGNFRSGTGAINGALNDIGIDDDFIYHVRSKVTEGASALFIMSSDAFIDQVVEASKGIKPELIATNVPKNQETRLRHLFAQPATAFPAAR